MVGLIDEHDDKGALLRLFEGLLEILLDEKRHKCGPVSGGGSHNNTVQCPVIKDDRAASQ